jgi:hypothetical protein
MQYLKTQLYKVVCELKHFEIQSKLGILVKIGRGKSWVWVYISNLSLPQNKNKLTIENLNRVHIFKPQNVSTYLNAK